MKLSYSEKIRLVALSFATFLLSIAPLTSVSAEAFNTKLVGYGLHPGGQNQVNATSSQSGVDGKRAVFTAGGGSTPYNVFYYDAGQLSQITNNTDLSAPILSTALADNSIVWAQTFSSNNNAVQLFVYDLDSAQTKQITSGTDASRLMTTSGKYIAWIEIELSSSNRNVYLYDMSNDTTTQIASNVSDARELVFSGDQLVWIQGGSSNNALYRFDTTTGTTNLMSTTSINGGANGAGGDFVWQGRNNDSEKFQVFWFHKATLQVNQITNTTQYQNLSPKLSGNSIVWKGSGLMRYDTVQGATETIAASADNLFVSGERIAWSQYSGGNNQRDVFTKDLETGEISKVSWQYSTQLLSLSSKLIIWWDETSSPSFGTYVTEYDLPASPVLSTTKTITNQSPELSWTTVPDATSYTIFRNDTQIASGLQANSYVDTGLMDEGAHNYYVKAVDSDGTSSLPSNTVSITYDITGPQILNPKMTPQFLINNHTTTITASVADNLTGISRVEYYVDTDPGVGNGLLLPHSNGSVNSTITINSTGGAHNFYIRAIDSAGNATTSAGIVFLYI